MVVNYYLLCDWIISGNHYCKSIILGFVFARSSRCADSRFWRRFKVAVGVNDVVKLSSCRWWLCSRATTSCRRQRVVILSVTVTQNKPNQQQLKFCQQYITYILFIIKTNTFWLNIQSVYLLDCLYKFLTGLHTDLLCVKLDGELYSHTIILIPIIIMLHVHLVRGLSFTLKTSRLNIT